MAAKLARAYNQYPMDRIDPGHTIWGVQRLFIDAALTASLVEDERLEAGDTEGISLQKQIKHKMGKMDTSGPDELERMRQELKDMTTG